MADLGSLYLVFANSENDRLQNLKDEWEGVTEILQKRSGSDFLMEHDPFADLDRIKNNLIKNQSDLLLFLFSGHAGDEQLFFEDAEGASEGMARLLGLCKKLGLVFLNGCSTKGQVMRLHELGVPAVIATSRAINDMGATQFSVDFFRSLNDGASIKKAFETAVASFKTNPDNKDIVVQEGLAKWPTEEKEDSIWGLYPNPLVNDPLSWTLPSNTVIKNEDPFEPNELLIGTLFNALSNHHENIRSLIERQDFGSKISIKRMNREISSVIPRLISVQLQALLNTKDVGLDRLKRLFTLYNTFMELIGFTMIAQLWDLMETKDDFNLDNENFQNQMRMLLLSSVEDRQTFNFGDLIEHTRMVLNQNQEPYFVTELQHLADTLHENHELSEALDTLERLRAKSTGVLEDGETREMCLQVERKLSTFLEQVAFITKYKLASVQRITVRKYNRHIKHPSYRHGMAELISPEGDPLIEPQDLDTPLDCNSILIMKEEVSNAENGIPKLSFLNLSPFVIDKNALEHAEEVDLFFFDRIERNGSNISFQFKRPHKPKDRWEVAERNFSEIINGPFSAFAERIFQKKLSEL